MADQPPVADSPTLPAAVPAVRAATSKVLVAASAAALAAPVPSAAGHAPAPGVVVPDSAGASGAVATTPALARDAAAAACGGVSAAAPQTGGPGLPTGALVCTIPADAMVITVGMPASGKSTFVRRLFERDEVASLDAWRETLGRPGDPTATPYAARLEEAQVRGRLERGLLVVVDNTNLVPRFRRHHAAMAREFHRPVVVFVFDTPEAECRRRNALRPVLQRVPDAAMDIFAGQWAQTRQSIGSEELGRVEVLGPQQAGALVVTRGPSSVGVRAVEHAAIS